MALEDEGERIQSHRVAGAPQVEHGAIGLGDPREESEADVTAPQVGLEAPLLGGPPATERPDVGGVGIVAAAKRQKSASGLFSAPGSSPFLSADTQSFHLLGRTKPGIGVLVNWSTTVTAV